jgi:hypothetical protein
MKYYLYSYFYAGEKRWHGWNGKWCGTIAGLYNHLNKLDFEVILCNVSEVTEEEYEEYDDLLDEEEIKEKAKEPWND